MHVLHTAWDALPKKKASGVDDCHLEVLEEVQDEFIVADEGIINKKRYLPKNLIAGFDGHTLYFRIMKAESKRYRHVNTRLRKITKKLSQ